jgi:RNA recognition motif-containing protein
LSSSSSNDECRLFVGGLSHKALDDTNRLLQALEEFGEVADLCTFDKQKYAFVTFAEQASAEAALTQQSRSDLFLQIRR